MEDNPELIVTEFRKQFYDTQLFFDPFTGGKFAHYFFKAYEDRGTVNSKEAAHQLIEEAQLFIEGCHSCYGRMVAQPVAAPTV